MFRPARNSSSPKPTVGSRQSRGSSACKTRPSQHTGKPSPFSNRWPPLRRVTPKSGLHLRHRHSNIGFTLRTRGRPADALRPYEQAREIQEQLARDYPDDPRYHEALSWTLSNIGVIQHEIGRPSVAIHLHKQTIAIHQNLTNRDPGNDAYRSDLAWCWRYLGLALLTTGETAAALRLLEQAAVLHEELVASKPEDPEFRWRLARCLDEVGRIHSRAGRPADADGPLGRSAELYESVARANPVRYRLDVARNQLSIACQRALTGRSEQALASLLKAEDLLNRPSSVSPALLYDLACAYSLCSKAVCPRRPSVSRTRGEPWRPCAGPSKPVTTTSSRSAETRPSTRCAHTPISMS